MRIVSRHDDQRHRKARRIVLRAAACATFIVGTVAAVALVTPAVAADLDTVPNEGPAYGPAYGPPGPPPYPVEPYFYRRPRVWAEPPVDYPPPGYGYPGYRHAYPPQAWNDVPPDAGRWARDPYRRYSYRQDGYGDEHYRQGPPPREHEWEHPRPYAGPYAELPRPPAPVARPPQGAWDGYAPEAPDDMVAEEEAPPPYGWRGPPPRW
jgi:hypothetical protein